ncbi:hypothetical protein H2199_001021 [Coniosporium tulheliwenetii]|uniref:Uncharacterized protein n=1 Tax=Coniosporium tulheliwenetii TaxID=3383036 RepID=A0ACC2ZNM0_9PEZI|nr:hypothetical protein H2199_001021 [Cladosporium sp. JES 115]
MASFLPRVGPRALNTSLRTITRPNIRPQRPSAPLLRRFLATPSDLGEQPRLRIGSTAPNFKATTTAGDIDFHEFIGDSWAILFSHPADYTPVCTTELGAFSKMKEEFDKRAHRQRRLLPFTIRSVFIIDPAKKIRLTMLYPAAVGRNTSEVLRVVDALQTGDKKGVVTPIDWQRGDDVIVPPSVSTEDAKKKFGEVREVKKYLRFTNVGE